MRGADRFRLVGSDLALLEPCRDEFCRRVIDGMQTEIVDPPSVAEYIRSTYPDLSSETLASGNLTVRLHDGLPPYGVGILDDRVAVCGHDPDNVSVRALVDTDDQTAREWAESTYAYYRRQTRPSRWKRSWTDGIAPGSRVRAARSARSSPPPVTPTEGNGRDPRGAPAARSSAAPPTGDPVQGLHGRHLLRAMSPLGGRQRPRKRHELAT